MSQNTAAPRPLTPTTPAYPPPKVPSVLTRRRAALR